MAIRKLLLPLTGGSPAFGATPAAAGLLCEAAVEGLLLLLPPPAGCRERRATSWGGSSWVTRKRWGWKCLTRAAGSKGGGFGSSGQRWVYAADVCYQLRDRGDAI